MFKIRVMNYREAFDYVYNHSFISDENNKKFAILSIQDTPANEMAVGYKAAGNCLAALNIWFSDLTESGFEDAKKRHPNWIGHMKLINDIDAMKIKEFVNYVSTLDIDMLIIHCRAGQSRSAGVAAAVSVALFGTDKEYFDDPRYTVNMTVYRKVLKAFGLDLSSCFSE